MNEAIDLPEWKQFEIAVADFLRALDPNAKVTHDAKIDDAHTGKPRQRDVWIEATICQLFQLKILVSCKFWNSRLNEQDVDAFNGELISSGAHKGVIYSKAGFTDEAIQKASALDVSCCRLYANHPPDIPESLIMTGYCSRNQILMTLREPLDTAWALKLWGELFSVEFTYNGESKHLIDIIGDIHDEAVDECLRGITAEHFFPQAWDRHFDLNSADAAIPPVKLLLGGRWKTYSAKAEAYLLNGTYSITNNQFVGQQATPAVDTWSVDPGPGWTLIEAPDKAPRGSCQIIVRGKAKKTLLSVLASKPIGDPV